MEQEQDMEELRQEFINAVIYGAMQNRQVQLHLDSYLDALDNLNDKMKPHLG